MERCEQVVNSTSATKPAIVYSRDKVAAHNEQMAAYIQQQELLEHCHSKRSKQRHPTRREQRDNQD